MSKLFGRDQSTESLGPMRKTPIGRNAINPVYVAWSAGGKRPSAIMAGGSQPANRDPTNNWLPASDWCLRYLSPALDDIWKDQSKYRQLSSHCQKSEKLQLIIFVYEKAEKHIRTWNIIFCWWINKKREILYIYKYTINKQNIMCI